MNVNAQDINGWTPLITAIINKIPAIKEVTKLLLQLGCDPAIMSRDGKNAFHWAARIGNKEALETMADILPSQKIYEFLNTCTLDAYKMKPIRLAARFDNLTAFSVLLNLEQRNRDTCIHTTYAANEEGVKEYNHFCEKCFAKNNIYTPDEDGKNLFL